VGDTRAWLLRGGECIQLTQDHVMGGAEFRNGLTRALGLEDAVRLDFVEGDVQIGDVFVLTSDGVHGSLSERRLRQLAQEGSAQAAADALVAAALGTGSQDNATALVLRV